MSMIVFGDIEATDLDTRTLHPLEISLVLASSALTPIARRTWLILPDGNWPEIKAGLNDVVREMHTANGLLDDIDALWERSQAGETVPTLHDVETEIMAWIGTRNPTRSKVSLAGSGVANYDLHIMRDQMPRLYEMFTYYTYDYGVLRRIGKTINIAAPPEASEGARKSHRSAGDVEMHLAEARWWREFLLRCRRAGIRGLDTTGWGDDEMGDPSDDFVLVSRAHLDRLEAIARDAASSEVAT